MARYCDTPVTLLQESTTTGDWKPWPGGRGALFVTGDPGLAELELQARAPNGKPVLVHRCEADGDDVLVAPFELPACSIRIAIQPGGVSRNADTPETALSAYAAPTGVRIYGQQAGR